MRFIGGIFEWMEMRRRRRNMETAVIFGIGCGGMLICGIIMVIVGSIINAVETGTVRATYGEYAGSCQSMPVGKGDEANILDAETPRQILLLTASTQRRHTWHSDLPAQWQAENEAEVSLIGCVEEEEILLETCEYQQESPEGFFTVRVERQQNQVTIALIHPDTARVIDSLTVLGSEPDDCPDDEEVTASSDQTGSEVEWDDFAEWIESYVFDD
ncbi:MAG: hypothetical protein AAF846_16985 [Chloroflexota bacterium]